MSEEKKLSIEVHQKAGEENFRQKVLELLALYIASGKQHKYATVSIDVLEEIKQRVKELR